MRRKVLVPAAILSLTAAAQGEVIVPIIEGDWWRVASNPDLGEYTSDRQEPVDFGVWQAADGTWQLWSCIRNTDYPGHTRVFHGWEGESITSTDWEPKGIMMESDPGLGEPLGGLQAPHVVRLEDRFLMAYGDWTNICFAESRDGKSFERIIQPGGRTGVFSEGELANARDPMMIRIDGLWHLYYTAITAGKGYGHARLSEDLENWSNSIVVSYGGKVGDNPWHNECPHVVEVEPGEFVYFRNQFYGGGNLNWVYHSNNPLNFGIDHDDHLVGRLQIAAPEIVEHDGRYYIATLTPELDGIRIARLRWARRAVIGEPLLDLDSAAARASWEGGAEDYFVTEAPGGLEFPAGHLLLTSAESTAELLSPPFIIGDTFHTVLVGGPNDRERAYVAIEDAETGEELARYTGRFRNQLERHRFDGEPFQGRKARVRIVDNVTGDWGRLAFGGIHKPGEPRIFK